MLGIKSRVVGTKVGEIAGAARSILQLQLTMLRHPEQAAFHASASVSARLRDRLCAPGGIFVDVGAHIGSVIDGVRRHSRPATIIAVEAIPSKAKSLRKRFPATELHNCALGEQPGTAEFTIDLEQSGYSSLDPALRNRGGRYEIIEVPVSTLDAVMGDREPDFIKIDVEGAELGVLRGGANVLAKARPTIMFESATREMGGYTKEGIYTFFADSGYELYTPTRLAHDAPAACLNVFLDAHEYPCATLDWFAVARERRTEIRDRARHIMGVKSTLTP